MDKTQRADALYQQAQEQHTAAYARAEATTDYEARMAKYREADRVYNMQLEYQRRVRHGEE